LVRSTCRRFLSRSFRSELKWDGNRTWRRAHKGTQTEWGAVAEPGAQVLLSSSYGPVSGRAPQTGVSAYWNPVHTAYWAHWGRHTGAAGEEVPSTTSALRQELQ
jgi:hypothetical protein